MASDGLFNSDPDASTGLQHVEDMSWKPTNAWQIKYDPISRNH